MDTPGDNAQNDPPPPPPNRQPGGSPKLPLMGRATGTVRAATPIDIHGDRYTDLALLLEGEQTPLAVRIPNNLLERPPNPGDRLTIDLLMGQPQSVAFQDAD